MPSLEDAVTARLRAVEFEVQRTSFGAITQEGEIGCLKGITKLPECDSSRILLHFPSLFVVHRTLPPDKGIFFVALTNDVARLPADAQRVYKQYLPQRVAIVGCDAAGALVVRWSHASGAPQSLDRFLKAEIGVQRVT